MASRWPQQKRCGARRRFTPFIGHRGRDSKKTMAHAVAEHASLKVFNRSDLTKEEVHSLMQRPRIDFSSILKTV
jgi:hypothetical protein